MRNGNLPAFASLEAARQFAGEQGGQLLRADQITPAVLAPLDTRSAQLHSTHAK
jgi:nitrous oxide reductase accessory protein NosL